MNNNKNNFMFCKECGAEIEDNSKHCPECGAKLSNDSANELEVLKEEKRKKSNRKWLIGCAVGLIVVFGIVALMGSGSNTSNTSLNVSGLSFTAGSYSSYDLTCTLVPDKDYNYLEARAIFYDSNGNILDKKSFGLWNEVDLKKGETYKISGKTYCDKTPAKAVIGFYKSTTADYEDALYNQTISL